MPTPQKSHYYILGAGIAGLATAAYLIRDGSVSGDHITILDAGGQPGGSLDAAPTSNHSYRMRGFRMFEDKVYSCTLDLMSFIPIPETPKISLQQDFADFNAEVRTNSHSRLLRAGSPIDARPLQLTLRDRLALLWFLANSERSLGSKTIADYFSSRFFTSDFWYEFATTFSFQPWHSVAEFRRYILRFLQDAPVIDTASCIRSTRYNQYDSLISPLHQWLEQQGVHFQMNATVTNIRFAHTGDTVSASTISYLHNEAHQTLELTITDKLFVTLGSMADNSSYGSMSTAPQPVPAKQAASWNLWEAIATQHDSFGNPAAFSGHTDQSHWVSFTMTFSNPLFFELMEKLTHNTPGTDGLVTITDSNWLLTVSLPNQPHFKNQPKDITVAWGYGLFPDAIGNFVQKPMHQCSGEEIMQELLAHLKFAERQPQVQDEILNSVQCIPSLLPYITSQFFPRSPGDRPHVVPAGATNFAFLGQFVEIPEDIVFTVEYSVRSAQMAVYKLLNIPKQPTPIYHGKHNLAVIINAIRTAFR